MFENSVITNEGLELIAAATASQPLDIYSICGMVDYYTAEELLKLKYDEISEDLEGDIISASVIGGNNARIIGAFGAVDMTLKTIFITASAGSGSTKILCAVSDERGLILNAGSTIIPLKTCVSFTVALNAGATVSATSSQSVYMTYTEAERFVTTHAAGSSASGDVQDIYGSKRFKAPNGTGVLVINSEDNNLSVEVGASIIPAENTTVNLGVSGRAFNNIIAGDITTATGTVYNLSCPQTLAVNTLQGKVNDTISLNSSLVPNTNTPVNIGSSSHPIAEITAQIATVTNITAGGAISSGAVDSAVYREGGTRGYLVKTPFQSGGIITLPIGGIIAVYDTAIKISATVAGTTFKASSNIAVSKWSGITWTSGAQFLAASGQIFMLLCDASYTDNNNKCFALIQRVA